MNVTSCSFTGGRALNGGGISLAYGVGAVTNSTFKSCSALLSGGAVRATSGSTLVVSHCVFESSTADSYGGGLDGELSPVAVSDSVFFDCWSWFDGGAAHIDETVGTFVNSSFVSCGADRRGGGLAGIDGADITANRTFFVLCSALHPSFGGGAVYGIGTDFKLLDSVFLSNSVLNSGAAVDVVTFSAVTAVRCRFEVGGKGVRVCGLCCCCWYCGHQHLVLPFLFLTS